MGQQRKCMAHVIGAESNTTLLPVTDENERSSEET